MTNYRQRYKNMIRRASWRLVFEGAILWEPCNHCGSAKPQLHHLNYNTPWDVQWLCRPCHRAQHASEGLVI